MSQVPESEQAAWDRTDWFIHTGIESPSEDDDDTGDFDEDFDGDFDEEYPLFAEPFDPDLET